jgi:pimeloyl-ACP methyl ester carboxylesterase
MTTHTHQTAPTQFVEADGVRFAYRRFGKSGGVPLVLNQHFIGTMDYWDPAVTDGLAQGREVILFNNAGISSSSGEVPTTIEGMGTRAVAFIKALGLKQVDVLGFSIGGLVAQEITLQAKAGAQVLIHYSTGEKEADAVVAEIRTIGGRAEKVGADLRQADGPHRLAGQVRAIVGDRLDILVANAGISKAASIEDTQVEDFDNLFAVNVRAPFFLVQQLLPVLGKGSSVIFSSSLAARSSVGTLAAYAATKGAIDTLVKHFAAALGPRGIRVNAGRRLETLGN